jgi:5,10-methenyltetrahydrofolate synthetase
MEPTANAEWREIAAWRKAERARLVAARQALSSARLQALNECITTALRNGLPVSAGCVVGFCWPFKGEYDARHPVRYWRERGAFAALPEVVASREPLVFRRWWPGAPMKRGVYDIPHPDGTDVVVPDIALVPMNGCDDLGYRLGYGGGYFDRTLAQSRERMIAIGVAFEALRVPTIHPQPHDIPMDFVVTEAGLQRAAGGRLRVLDAGEASAAVRSLMIARKLPKAAPAGGAEYASPPCFAGEYPGFYGEDPKAPPENPGA